MRKVKILKSIFAITFMALGSLSIAQISFLDDGLTRKGDWVLAPGSTCAHKCVKGSEKNCIITGGVDTSGCGGNSGYVRFR